MFKFILVVTISHLSFFAFGQTTAQLKSRIEFCKHENERLEKELAKHKGLLNMQTQEVQELKLKVQEKDKQIAQLKREKEELNEVAIHLLNVALKLEQMGDYKAAAEVYRVLIKSFPNSLEAASSRIQIEDLRKNLEK